VVPDLKVLLDTHVWMWAVLGHRRLSRAARAALGASAARDKVGLASISLKEASWHLSQGRIAVSGSSWEEWLRQAAGASQLEILPLTVEVAIASERFTARFPKDPADRIIAATAIVHGLTLLTADRHLRRSKEVPTLW
jgi:PIN domain nuclease of toxin-antitoxin system